MPEHKNIQFFFAGDVVSKYW